MSFILDALRKSDAERQRTAAPGLADIRYAARRARRNIWLPILVAVLTANVLFMGVQWFGRARTGQVPALPASALPGSAPPASALPAPSAGPVVAPEPATAIRSLARESDFGEPQLEAPMERESVPVVSETTAQTPTVPGPAPTPAAPPTPPQPSRILPANDLPTVEEAIGSGTVKIPMLNLDLHVYSENVASRFVIINTHKYKEGGQLTEGPSVESITKDGVILAFQGQRFTLSRR